MIPFTRPHRWCACAFFYPRRFFVRRRRFAFRDFPSRFPTTETLEKAFGESEGRLESAPRDSSRGTRGPPSASMPAPAPARDAAADPASGFVDLERALPDDPATRPRPDPARGGSGRVGIRSGDDRDARAPGPSPRRPHRGRRGTPRAPEPRRRVDDEPPPARTARAPFRRARAPRAAARPGRGRDDGEDLQLPALDPIRPSEIHRRDAEVHPRVRGRALAQVQEGPGDGDDPAPRGARGGGGRTPFGGGGGRRRARRRRRSRREENPDRDERVGRGDAGPEREDTPEDPPEDAPRNALRLDRGVLLRLPPRARDERLLLRASHSPPPHVFVLRRRRERVQRPPRVSVRVRRRRVGRTPERPVD